MSAEPVLTGLPRLNAAIQSGPLRDVAAGTGRLAFIDSLRGVAALYVVMFHQLAMLVMVVRSHEWAPPFLINGRSGVTLFFVISAFSLCLAHRQGFSRVGDLRAFYLRRAARILPLFYVMLLITLIRNQLIHWPISPGQTSRAVLVIFNLVPGDEGGVVPGAWTIGTEIVFYAVFPFVFMRLRTLSATAAAFVAAVLAATVFHRVVLGFPFGDTVNRSFYNCSFLRHFPTFLLGMGAWLLFGRFIRDRAVPPAIGAVLIFGSLWADYAYMHGALNILFPDPYYWEAIIFASLLLGLAILPTPLIVNRLTLFCGRISYSLYLLHPTIMFACAPLYRTIDRWHCSLTLRYTACLAISLACIIPLASLSYRLIERPGMRLGNRLIGSLPR